MTVDLHTHSTISDGSDPPERIPELAFAAGCSAVALTDHDRLDGIAAARESAARHGVELVAGCEISCETARGSMHLLVYFLEPGEGPLQDELLRMQAIRNERNTRMIARLAELGLPVTMEEVEAEAGGVGMGRPHVAAVLLRKGVVRSVQEAFDVWLARGRPAYVEKERLTPPRAIALAVASGALAVLAHPHSLELDAEALERTVSELVGLGLVGLEAMYGRYPPADRDALAALAARQGLVATGGSDHHGTYKPDLRVGSGRGDLDVPDQVLEALRARL